MANNCLLTKYKAVIDNDNLEKYGYLKTKEVTTASFSKNPMATSAGKVFLTKGTLKNTWTNETFEAGVMYDSFGTPDAQFSALSTPIQFGTTDKYAIKSVSEIELSKLKYSFGIENLTGITIDVPTEEANAIINKFTGLKYAVLSGNVSPSAFEDLNSLEYIECSDFLEGEDMSIFPNKLCYVYAGGTRRTMHWLDANPRTGYVCAIRKGVDLGNDLDNYLISNAAATLGKSPSATNEWNGTKINIYGTRTSASDSAVATLKSLGFTVVVNDETL